MTLFHRTVTELLGEGIAVRFRAKGDSMHPSIRCGEHVHVAPAEAATLQPGDVVLVHAARGLTAHRIIAADATHVVTRGDNAPTPDAAVERRDVLGIIIHVERDGVAVPVPPAPRLRVVARRAVRRFFSLSTAVRRSA